MFYQCDSDGMPVLETVDHASLNATLERTTDHRLGMALNDLPSLRQAMADPALRGPLSLENWSFGEAPQQHSSGHHLESAALGLDRQSPSGATEDVLSTASSGPAIQMEVMPLDDTASGHKLNSLRPFFEPLEAQRWGTPAGVSTRTSSNTTCSEEASLKVLRRGVDVGRSSQLFDTNLRAGSYRGENPEAMNKILLSIARVMPNATLQLLKSGGEPLMASTPLADQIPVEALRYIFNEFISTQLLYRHNTMHDGLSVPHVMVAKVLLSVLRFHENRVHRLPHTSSEGAANIQDGGLQLFVESEVHRSHRRERSRRIPWEHILAYPGKRVPLSLQAAAPSFRRRAEQLTWLSMVGHATACWFPDPRAPIGTMDMFSTIDPRHKCYQGCIPAALRPVQPLPAPPHTSDGSLEHPDGVLNGVAHLGCQRQSLLIDYAWRNRCLWSEADSLSSCYQLARIPLYNFSPSDTASRALRSHTVWALLRRSHEWYEDNARVGTTAMTNPSHFSGVMLSEDVSGTCHLSIPPGTCLSILQPVLMWLQHRHKPRQGALYEHRPNKPLCSATNDAEGVIDMDDYQISPQPPPPCQCCDIPFASSSLRRKELRHFHRFLCEWETKRYHVKWRMDHIDPPWRMIGSRHGPTPRPLAIHMGEEHLPWLARMLLPDEGGLADLQELYFSFEYHGGLSSDVFLISAWRWVKALLSTRKNILLLSIVMVQNEGGHFHGGESTICSHSTQEQSPFHTASTPSQQPPDMSLLSSARLTGTAVADGFLPHIPRSLTTTLADTVGRSSLDSTMSCGVPLPQTGLAVHTTGLPPSESLGTPLSPATVQQHAELQGRPFIDEVFSGLESIASLHVVSLMQVTPDVLGWCLGRATTVGTSVRELRPMRWGSLRELYVQVDRRQQRSREEVSLDVSHDMTPHLQVLWVDAPRIRHIRFLPPTPLREVHLVFDHTFLFSMLEGIEGLPCLEVLHVEKAFVNDLAFLRGSTTLKELLLHACRFPTLPYQMTPLAGVEEIPSLECLSIMYTNDVKDLRHLRTCHSLRKLVLTRCNGISSNSLEGLAALPRLEILSLEYTRVSRIHELSTATSLRTLRLDGCKRVLSSFIQGLEMCPALQELRLCDTNISTVANLGAGCVHLRSLDLSGCHHLDLEGVQGIQALPLLQVLNLSHTPVASVHFLADCRALVSLLLVSCTQLESDGMVGLESIHTLQCVIANDCPQLEMVGHLGRSRSLRWLSFAHVERLQTHGLMGVERCRTLEYLQLMGTGVEGVAFLANGCPALRFLGLRACSKLLREELVGLGKLHKLEEIQLD